MGFFEQAWIGLKKELAIYKNDPKQILIKGISVIIFVGLTVITASTSGGSLESSTITNAICQMEIFFTPARAILFKISTERAENFKEYLMINGMTKAAYQAKNAVSCYIEMFFYSIPQAVGLYLSYRQYYSDWTAILENFLVLFMGGVATVNIALFLATLFSPKNAPPIGSMILLLLGLLYFVPVYVINTLPIYLLVSLHPGAAIALGVNSSLPAIDPNDPNGVYTTTISWKGYSPYVAVLILFLDSAIYLALYLYQERESDVDAKKAIKGKKEAESIALPLMNKSSVLDLEAQNRKKDHTSAVHYERIEEIMNRPKTIEALHINKIYTGCTAVDDISFSIHEHEIFCAYTFSLLGHNGAGKSTLVNILTGLIPKTLGRFFYNGEEVDSDLDRIRGQVGFCPQKDFLLMENTVYENLTFFAEIKKVPNNELDKEVERVMNKLGLTQFKDMPAKKLSGGFKRKLNVGIALLKDPKIIVMDEPTSGMDPVSRRNFWAIIKALKNENKTVVLTTQFLDEAEELADRVAIMTKGKLFAVGTSEFLKKKFGTGYNLIVQKRDGSPFDKSQSMEVTSKVQEMIPIATKHQDTANNVLQYVLPFSEQSSFSKLFSWLEATADFQISLQMVSLEEAFVSLGLDLDKVGDHSQHQDKNGFKTNIPASFFRERTPTFMDQLIAIIIARYYKMKKNVRVLFFSCFPLLFVVGGIAIGGNLSNKQGGLGMIVSMALTGNAFLIGSFTIPVSTERVMKITHTLRAMGLRTVPYWIGNFIVDFCLKMIMSLLVLGSIYLFNVDFLQDVIGTFAALYIGFSFNMIILAYNISLTFDNMVAIMVSGPCLLIGGGILPNLISNIFQDIFGINLNMYVYIVSFIFFGPAILLQLGVNLMVPQYGDATYLTYAPFSQPYAYIILSFGMGILYFLKLLYSDSKTFELNERKKFQSKEDEEAITIEEDDIIREKERLNSSANTDLIKAIEVQKIYPNGFKALHDLSFGTERGQVFCLLGPNGAGKTTAFEIITATIPKTEGKIQLEGKDLSRSRHEIFYDVGICSQSNTLWDYVTVTEHLRIYARIKGMKEPEIEEIIRFLLKSLQLEEYAERTSEQLSGGNKRKLCVGMAMIGAPKLLFLDEPSTGMDPVARSFLWTLIKDVMRGKQGAMVLTTHYMQEAELVGDKLGILVNGRFTTIGSMSELKKKFGEYSVIVYEEENGLSKGDIERIVKSVLPDARKHNRSGEKGIVFKVPSSSMSFTKTFSELEAKKSEGAIKDFSIYTTTLEQIFIKLAKQQRRLTES